MRAALLILSVLLARASGLASDNREQPLTEYDAVKQTVQFYFESMNERDIEKMKRAVHPRARWLYTSQVSSLLGEVTQPEIEARMKKSSKVFAGPKTKVENSSNERSVERIVAIDVVGDIASVKIEIENPAVLTTQYLSLMKFSDQWKIVSAIVRNELK